MKLDTPIPEPDSSFAQSASDRESQLRKRKDYMIQQARLKYLDKEASRKKEVSSL